MVPDSTRARNPRGGGRRGPTFLSVLGELLMTAGVVTLLFVVWQLWVGDLIYGAQANTEGEALSERWAAELPAPVPSEGAEPVSPATADPVILPEPSGTEEFAVMRIPRFGQDYAFPIAGGVTKPETLDRGRIGYYPGASMPGESGNFSLAGHRTTYGAPFGRIADLRLGDAIVVETEVGWYTYRFRTLEYVAPTAVDVLLPVPQDPELTAGTAYLTMTSCSPKFSAAERIIAYGVFESFTPRENGAPLVLTQGTDA